MESKLSGQVDQPKKIPLVETDDELFQSQFETRNKSNTVNGEFEYAHIAPKNPEGDPLIFHPGWLANVKACEQLAKEAYSLNQDAYFLDLVGHNPPGIKNDVSYDKYTLRNAQAMAQIALDQNLKHVNLVGHSEGASVSLVAAELLLKKGIDVKNVVLINPTGFGLSREKGLQTKIELIKRGVKMAWEEFLRGKSNKNPMVNNKVELDVKHMARHPINTAREGLAMANLDMAKLQEEIISRGVNVSIIQAEDDPFVRIEDLNTEVQLTEQRNRQAQITKELNKTKNLSTEERNTKLEEKVAGLQKLEENRTITSAIGKPGHLFRGHSHKTFIGPAISRIRYISSKAG